MKTKLAAITVAVGALIWAAPAVAGGGGGGAGAAQAGIQYADTTQGAAAGAVSTQNAVNANVPVSIAGHDVYAGSSSATQNADSNANAKATNDATTNQTQTQTQNVGGSSCSLGCGGAGAAQIGAQVADTDQGAEAKAISDQNAVNANVPVSIAGHDVKSDRKSGSSSADQNADSHANAKASNDATTNQTQTQTQNVGGKSDCKAGCGGAGGAQIGAQIADTDQGAKAKAISKQNAVNANVPVSVAGDDVQSGSSKADQNADSSAKAKASNDATTNQTQTQTQNVGGGSSCKLGCGGDGGFQAGVQKAETNQWAGSFGLSDQNAVNANVPVSIAGDDVKSGSSSADQTADSHAKAKASNDATTNQTQTQTQNVGGGRSSCYAGCGGAGAAQIGAQIADTDQWAGAKAISKQNAVNANTPVAVAGDDVWGGSSSATQHADSSAKAKAKNDADTTQTQTQTQNVGGGSSCRVGCGGPGAAQIGLQKAKTNQWAGAFALSHQNAVNTNAPKFVAGDDIWGGASSADQHAASKGRSKARNNANTVQGALQGQ